MKTIGYLRVSSDNQALEKNKAEILRFANQKNLGQVIWVEEIVSGRVSWRQRKIGGVMSDLYHLDFQMRLFCGNRLSSQAINRQLSIVNPQSAMDQKQSHL